MHRSLRLHRRSPKAASAWSRPTWVSNTPHAEAFKRREFNVETLSNVDSSRRLSVAESARLIMKAAFVPQDKDAKVFGGTGATHRNEVVGDLKSQKTRMQTYNHPELMDNYLKMIEGMDAPNHKKLDPDFLRDKIVGILFFSETPRSMEFLRTYHNFHVKHQPDYVPLGISMCQTERLDISRQFGLYHVTHTNGAEWVARDCNVSIRPLMPLPRLIVCEGNTGREITRSGVTAVLTKPDTCFREWVRGIDSVGPRDFVSSWFL